MRRQQLGTFAIALLAILACDKVSDIGNGYVDNVSFVIDRLTPVGDIVPQTRTTMNADENDFVWSARDTIGIYPDTGSQVYFVTPSGQQTGSATFDGGGWSFKESSTYSCYYPFVGDIYLKRNRVPASFEGQKQTGTSDYSHIGRHHYMYTDPTRAANGSLSFALHHLSCFIRPKLTLPAGTYTKLAIVAPEPVFVKKGYFDLTASPCSIIPTEMTDQLQIDLEGITLTQETTFRVYLASAPVNLAEKEITICVLDNQRKERQCKKTPSAAFNLVAGALAGLTCNTWTEVPQSMGLILEDWGDGGSIGGSAD